MLMSFTCRYNAGTQAALNQGAKILARYVSKEAEMAAIISSKYKIPIYDFSGRVVSYVLKNSQLEGIEGSINKDFQLTLEKVIERINTRQIFVNSLSNEIKAIVNENQNSFNNKVVFDEATGNITITSSSNHTTFNFKQVVVDSLTVSGGYYVVNENLVESDSPQDVPPPVQVTTYSYPQTVSQPSTFSGLVSSSERITLNSQTSSNLSEIEEINLPSSSSEYAYISTEVEGSRVRLRESASLDSDIITQVPDGEAVKIIEKSDFDIIDGYSGNWYRVEYNWYTGYVWGRYLRF